MLRPMSLILRPMTSLSLSLSLSLATTRQKPALVCHATPFEGYPRGLLGRWVQGYILRPMSLMFCGAGASGFPT